MINYCVFYWIIISIILYLYCIVRKIKYLTKLHETLKTIKQNSISTLSCVYHCIMSSNLSTWGMGGGVFHGFLGRCMQLELRLPRGSLNNIQFTLVFHILEMYIHIDIHIFSPEIQTCWHAWVGNTEISPYPHI